MLTAVVPVKNMAGKLANMRSWVTALENNEIKVVIVEDGEDAETLLELQEIKASSKSKQITIISGNYGSPGLARNAGLDLVTSKWVAFWDSDDLPSPEKYIDMVQAAERQGAQYAIGRFATFDLATESKLISSSIGLSSEDIALSPGIWRWVFRTDFIGTTRFIDAKMAEDQVFLMEMATWDSKGTVFNDFIYQYFQNVDGQLTSNSAAISDLVKVIPLSLQIMRSHHDPQRKFDELIVARQFVTAFKRLGISQKIQVSILFLPAILRNPRLICGIKTVISFRMSKFWRNNITSEVNVSLTGGLGNQLFQLAAAIDLSPNQEVNCITTLGNPRRNQSGDAEIQSFKFPTNIKFKNNKTNSWLSKKTAGYLLRSGIWPRGLEKNMLIKKFTLFAGSLVLSLHLRRFVKVVSATKIGFEKIALSIQRTQLMIGYFQSSYWVSNAGTLKALKSMHLENPHSELRELLESAKREQPLIVHVRLGDYRNEPTFGLLDSDYYKRALELLDNVFERCPIWVFSDEIDEAKSLMPSRFHDRIRWISEVDNSTTATLEAMRLGQGYVIANSSFSWWAAMLSHHDKAFVVAPDPWFVGQEPPEGLIPLNWTLLSR
jgi:glycosyltransferase involved in cell wall biosynthesis